MPASTASHDSTGSESDDDLHDLPDFGDNIDIPTFEQILEMDDDEKEREFSSSIVFNFFEQAETTFKNMRDALKTKDLKALSQLGHFLKGSSATLGLTKVGDSCEKIQHYGSKLDDTGTKEVADETVCLDKIKAQMSKLEEDYNEVEVMLRKFYKFDPKKSTEEDGDEEDDEDA